MSLVPCGHVEFLNFAATSVVLTNYIHHSDIQQLIRCARFTFTYSIHTFSYAVDDISSGGCYFFIFCKIKYDYNNKFFL